MQLIYQGKSKRCLPTFTFPSNFHVTLPRNHWSNLKKCDYLSIFARQKEEACLRGRPALLDYHEYFQSSRQRRNETIMCKE